MSMDSCVEIKECPFSGITNSGKSLEESDAQNVLLLNTCLFDTHADLDPLGN